MTARFTISLSDAALARIDALAAEQGLTRSELVREAAEQYIAVSENAASGRKKRLAGENLLASLEEFRSLPAIDDRPTLDILREIRGPLGKTRTGGAR